MIRFHKILIVFLIIFLPNKLLLSQKIQGDNGHLYEFVEKPVKWATAKTACESRSTMVDQLIVNGHLATIQSNDDLEIILNLVHEHINTIWIGGTDMEKEGTWEWVTGEKFDFSNWEAGEPNGEKSENCLEMFAHNHERPGFWNDNRCDSNIRLSYVCEFSGPD